MFLFAISFTISVVNLHLIHNSMLPVVTIMSRLHYERHP